METPTTRRTLLGTVAGCGIAPIAGCLGDDGEPTDTADTDDPDDDEQTDDEDPPADDETPDWEVPEGWVELSASSSVPDGAWTWFTGERAIVDLDAADGPRVLSGSVAAQNDHSGDINVLWWDLGTGTRGAFTLHENLETDDHNNPALMIRPDGRYLAMYATHGNETVTRYRITVDPHDPSEWREEQTYANNVGTTYSNVYRLPDDRDGEGRTYCFTRTRNIDPNVLVSTDAGETWSYGGKLVARGGNGDRPYPRYASDGETIHVITTEEHPRRFENGIYHGYVENGVLYDSAGDILNDEMLDGTSLAPDPTELTQVYQPGTTFDGAEMGRAWTVDLAVTDGTPVGIFSAREDDDPRFQHYFYASRAGGEWSVAHIAEAGPPLYEGEKDYTGLASVDPSDPSRIIMSSMIDPETDTDLSNRHLFAGVTDDRGENWSWQDLTPDTTVDNIRPVIPRWEGEHTALVWMSGWYWNFRAWETKVMAAIDPIEQGLRYDGIED